MKKYTAPTYEREVIETEDIMSASSIVQEGETTNAFTSIDELFGKIESAIRFGE